jgi:hypothetical protein
MSGGLFNESHSRSKIRLDNDAALDKQLHQQDLEINTSQVLLAVLRHKFAARQLPILLDGTFISPERAEAVR